jgi:S-adenosylhomocysteine hydrolase
VNVEHGFVVVDFASQTMPEAGTLVNVYRAEKRVGGIRITEPVHAPLATADIVEGDMRVGDEVR